MHYSTRVQIAQEKQIAGMMIATNALQVAAYVKNEEPPKIAAGMSDFLRDIVMSLPRYQRANTFPGSKPNRDQSNNVTGFEEDAAIPATGAGQFLSERTEEAKGRPEARDQLRAERLDTA